jgi:hypothetical protein
MGKPIDKVGGDILGTPEVIGTITINGTTYTKKRLIIKTPTLPTAGGTLDIPLDFTHNAILSIHGTTNNTSGYCHPLPYINLNNSGQIVGGVSLQYRGSNEKLIRIVATSDMSSHYAFITIEYY